MGIFSDKKGVRFCIFLVISFLVLSARANTAKEFLEILDLVTFEPESERALKHIGEEIHKFVADKRNAKILKTPYGRELILRHKKLANYLIIKKKLDECATSSNRELSARILDAAGDAEVVEIDCNNPFEGLLTLQNYIGDFQQQFDAQAKSYLQTYLFEQALKNSASTYLNLKLQFGNSTVAPSMALDICNGPGGSDLCGGEEIRRNIFNHAKHYIENFNKSHNANRLGLQLATSAINGKVAELNKEFEEISFKSNSREISDDSKETFRNSYVDKYLSVATSGPGILMLTESLKNKIGGLRESETGWQTRGHGGRKYVLTSHQKVTASDVANAAKEAEDTVKQQVRNLSEMEYSQQKQMKGDFIFTNLNTLRNNDLSRLLRVNPQSFGQVLISHPQFTSIVCRTVDTVSEKAEPDDKWNKAYLWGGMIVGGTPMVPEALEDKLVILDKSIAPAISSVGAITTSAGRSIGISDGSLPSSQALEARTLLVDLKRLVLGAHKTAEARQVLTDFNTANMQATLSLGLAPSEVAALVGSVRAAQRGNESSIEGLKGTIEVLNNISKNPKRVELIKETRLKGGADVAQFIGYLGYATENTRSQLLNKMDSLNPQQFKKIIEAAIGGIYGCGQ